MASSLLTLGHWNECPETPSYENVNGHHYCVCSWVVT